MATKKSSSRKGSSRKKLAPPSPRELASALYNLKTHYIQRKDRSGGEWVIETGNHFDLDRFHYRQGPERCVSINGGFVMFRSNSGEHREFKEAIARRLYLVAVRAMKTGRHQRTADLGYGIFRGRGGILRAGCWSLDWEGIRAFAHERGWDKPNNKGSKKNGI